MIFEFCFVLQPLLQLTAYRRSHSSVKNLGINVGALWEPETKAIVIQARVIIMSKLWMQFPSYNYTKEFPIHYIKFAVQRIAENSYERT